MIYLGAVVVEAGFRGISTLYQPIFRDILRLRRLHLNQESFLFGAVANPYAYAALAKRVHTLLPAPAHPRLETHILDRTVEGLSRLYGTGLDFDRTNGLVRPSIALSPVAEKQPNRRDAMLNFFVARNPGYQEGVGLLYAAPLTLGTFANAWHVLRVGRWQFRLLLPNVLNGK